MPPPRVGLLRISKPNNRRADFLELRLREQSPLPSPAFSAIFAPAVAKVYIVSFCTLDGRLSSKFIVLADNMREAINEAWEHGGADF
jgi:hypothetical protein